MSLRNRLLEDLQRQYFYSGRADKKPTMLGVVSAVLSPRFLPVVLFRIAHKCYEMNLGPIAKAVSFLNFEIFGLEIAARCRIGGGLYLPHTQGTVIGAISIGENATIYHNVTLGAREVDLNYSGSARPKVGSNVVLGAGAKVLGGITIGDNVKVGANAVVIDDVVDGLTVVGIPACAVTTN